MRKEYFISKEYLLEHYVKLDKSTRDICKELNIRSKTVILRYLKKYNIQRTTNRIGKPNLKTRKGYKDISGSYICSLKARALNAKLEYSIDAEYLWNLYIKQNKKCKFTGIELILPNKYKNHLYKNIASLDRIDSSKGYIKDNVQWVHKIVNKMKWDLTDTDFINWCHVISKYDITNKLS